jgi:hypothetical protein
MAWYTSPDFPFIAGHASLPWVLRILTNNGSQQHLFPGIAPAEKSSLIVE